MPITQTLSSLGTPPSIDDPANFETRADALLTAGMPTFVTQMNAVITQANTLETNVNTKESTATTAATTATTQAGIATTQAGIATTQAGNAAASAAAADASAAAAAALAGAFTGTSTSSVAIGTGNKTFTTQSGEQYTAGVYLIAVSQANTANFMFGQVVSYAGTSLVLNVQATGGSGTYADWNLSLAGVPGPAGTGITNQATGFTATGGTSPRTLTVDVDLTASAVATTAGTQTLTNKTLTAPAVNNQKLNTTRELVTVSATAATGTVNYDALPQSVLFYTSNASANWTVNLRGDGSNSLNTMLAVGESLTVAFLVTQGATPYYNTTVQVDGATAGVTTRWQGGTAPAAGNASGVDVYSYTIIKTGNATFSVFAAQVQFK
jgi:hypothetical protein